MEETRDIALFWVVTVAKLILLSTCFAPGGVQSTASNPRLDPGGREGSMMPILQMRTLRLRASEALMKCSSKGSVLKWWEWRFEPSL